MALEAESGGASGGDGAGRKKESAASFMDVLSLCAPDWPLFTLASTALLLAALSQVKT